MSRRRLLVAVLAVALGVAGAFAVRGGDEDTGPERPMPRAERPAGTVIGPGVRVPPGAVLLGGPVPVDAVRTRSYLRLTGDPAQVWSAFQTGLAGSGHTIHLGSEEPGGCGPRHPDRFRRPRAGSLPGTPPTWLECRLIARPAPVGDPVLDRRSVQAELLVGGGRGVRTANELTVTTSTYDLGALPEGAGSRPAPPALTIPVPPAARLPQPGDDWAVSPDDDPAFHVVRGSHVLELRTDLMSVGDRAECTGRAFSALLAVTGDVAKVHAAYVGQVGGELATRRRATAAGQVLETTTRRTRMFSTQTAMLTMRSLTNRDGETYATLEYCRE